MLKYFAFFSILRSGGKSLSFLFKDNGYRPGTSVDLILQLDLLKEKIDVRRAIIYDVEGDEYILSQTMPAVRPSDMGNIASVTRLIHKGDQPVRWGFSGTLIDIIRNYRLGLPTRSSRCSSGDFLHRDAQSEDALPRETRRKLVDAHRRRPHAGEPDRYLPRRRAVQPQQRECLRARPTGSSHLYGAGREEVRDPVDRKAGMVCKGKPHNGLEFVALQFTHLEMELQRELGGKSWSFKGVDLQGLKGRARDVFIAACLHGGV